MSGLAQSTSAVVGDVPNVARRRSGTTIGGRDSLNADAVRALIEGGIKSKSALNIKLPPRPQSPPPRSPPPLAMDTIWKILIAAFIASVVIFLQILACLIGPDGGHWILMIILIPLILSPVPFGLLRLCGGGGDSIFSEKPKGTHWAEFMTSFFLAGTIGIPIVLQLTNSITWPSLVLSPGATIIGIVASFVGMWCANRNNNEANFGMVRRRPRRAHARAPAPARAARCAHHRRPPLSQ